MEPAVIEQQYPISFHKNEAAILGKHLRNRHNVVLIGMKRVGISNFLRFFLYHKSIAKTYIGDEKKHIFIPVDLNDLVEKEIVPFWTLTLKRIVDGAQWSNIPQDTKKQIESLFLDSIQTQTLFLTIDSVRKSLLLLIQAGFMPTLFFLRFDRLAQAATPEFFANLHGLQDATHQKIAYVFTSYRSLDAVSPKVFTKANVAAFANEMYIKPANIEDAEIIFKTYKDQYGINITPELKLAIADMVDGYVRYLHLALINLHERQTKMPADTNELFQALIHDERVFLQSEELWESLLPHEQEILQKIEKGKKITAEQKQATKYLWETGFVSDRQDSSILFSPLFVHYVSQKEKKTGNDTSNSEFTKKEQLMFDLLKQHINQVCERELIVERVWPEVEDLGVSDWAIDRLVARVRSKLKVQKSEFEIQTIKTRGYKLISS